MRILLGVALMLVVGVGLGCLVSGFLGWLFIVRPEGDRFNWRIFLGPWAYYRWADSQERR